MSDYDREWRKKKKVCASLDNLLIGLLLVLVILAIAAIMTGNFRSFRSENTLRFCVTAKPVVTSGGDTAGLLEGMVDMDSASQTISYLFHYNTTNLSPIMAINMHGPRLPGNDIAPLLFSLCGVTTVCDISSVSGQVTGVIQKLDPGQRPVDLEIVNIRGAPFKYYIEVLTGSHPSSPGALRAPLTSTCGFAI